MADNGDDSGSAQRQQQGPNPGLKTLAAELSDQWMTPFGMGNIDATGKRGGGGEFAKQVEMSPTPDGGLFADGFDQTPEEWEARRAKLADQCGNGNGAGTPLAMAAHLWSTPRSTDGEKGGPNMAFGAGGTPLPTQAAAMSSPPPSARPTAGANDHKGSNQPGQRRCQLDEAAEQMWGTPGAGDDTTTADLRQSRKDTGRTTDYLSRQSIMWSTPTGEDAEQSGSPNANHVTLNRQATDSPCSLPAPATDSPGPESSPTAPTSPRPRLSPIFVAWLMGWPLTVLGICDCSVTASSRFRAPTPSCGCGTAWFRRMGSELAALVR